MQVTGGGSGEPEGLGLVAMRAWLWFVPVALLVASAVFSVIAALDGRWALLAVMLIIGVFALGLMALHWWIMYRFGGQQAPASKRRDVRPDGRGE